jgi:hypothetical protein
MPADRDTLAPLDRLDQLRQFVLGFYNAYSHYIIIAI